MIFMKVIGSIIHLIMQIIMEMVTITDMKIMKGIISTNTVVTPQIGVPEI